jgi:antirestriction protein ArdC
MEEHGNDWTNPMVSGTVGGWPVNPVTKKRYNGVNVALLLMAGGGHWATYKQWASKAQSAVDFIADLQDAQVEEAA